MGNNELSKRVYIREIKDVFNLTQVTGDNESLDRWVIAPDINRPGLELSGYKKDTELKRIVVIGVKEQEYIKTLSYEVQRDRFDFLTDSFTPCIIYTANAEGPQSLKDVANSKNCPVFVFPFKTYSLTTQLTTFLSEKLAPVEQVHGVMMNIYGIGVLIIGKSGIGKSELALDLIKRGHYLVADDVVEYSRFHYDIVCNAPDCLKRMLEIRGLGVIDVNLMFGAQSYLEKCDLDFVIKLVSASEFQENNNRLEPAEKRMAFFDVEKTLLEIPVTYGKNMSPIVEAAVSNYILKNNGVDTNEEFKRNIKNMIIKKIGEHN